MSMATPSFDTVLTPSALSLSLSLFGKDVVTVGVVVGVVVTFVVGDDNDRDGVVVEAAIADIGKEGLVG